MPVKSAKQFRLMRAVLSGKSNKVPKNVAQEFINKTSHKQKSKYTKQQ